jgi:hypothetical protein
MFLISLSILNPRVITQIEIPIPDIISGIAIALKISVEK